MVNEKDVMRKLKYFAGIAAALILKTNLCPTSI